MLNAILHGKKRGSGIEGESLAGDFGGAEDTLTATLFERLTYLPDEIICKILFRRDMWQDSVRSPERVVSVQYWPRWESFSGGGQKEPDLVIEFDDRVLIVEAKRFDFADQQSPVQLASEWLAGHRAYEGQGKGTPWLLAVGGLRDTRQQTIAELRSAVGDIVRSAKGAGVVKDLRFAAVPWFHLFHLVEAECEHRASSEPQLARLLEDIRRGMLAHGVAVSPPAWLADLLTPAWKASRQLSQNSLSTFARPPCPNWREFRPITSSPHIFLTGPVV